MKFKKCGFLLSLVMVICFSIPGFASAEVVDLLEGKQGLWKENNNKILVNMTDGNENTRDAIFGDNPVIFDLGDSFTVDKYDVNYSGKKSNVDSTGINVVFYDKDFKLIKGIRFYWSHTEKIDNVRYVGIYYNYLNPLHVFDFKVYGKTDKVTNVENLKAEVDSTKVNLSWVNSDSPKFSGVKIYQDGKFIAKVDKSVNSYVVKNLELAKSYNFKVTSLDQDGFETSGVSTSASIGMPVLPPPEKVFLTPQNKKMVIAWDDVRSPYFKGYNVYIDGKKVNDEPLYSSKLVVKDLENNKSYKVQVSTVNKANVEGQKSKVKEDKPSSDALEVSYDVNIPFSIKDVVGAVMVFLAIVAPLILLGFALRLYKPFIKIIYGSIRNKGRRDGR
ncbi:fibronectin type III domain-containing protein [Bacillus mobilis]|uniref:fibronectin type III domain-containing protein n=1 Tax=Bacillus mobilis TaxID=2026190 RepID=UPI003CF58791